MIGYARGGRDRLFRTHAAEKRQRKSRPSVYQTEERQHGIKLPDEESLPPFNNTAPGGRSQGFFEAILPKGAENGLPMTELECLSGLDRRTVQRCIATERKAGAVILSGNGSYYLPDDGDKGRLEAEAFILTTKAKALNTLLAVKSAQEFLDILPGQEEIGADNAEYEKAPLGKV